MRGCLAEEDIAPGAAEQRGGGGGRRRGFRHSAPGVEGRLNFIIR
jgi:hypothetical protein